MIRYGTKYLSKQSSHLRLIPCRIVRVSGGSVDGIRAHEVQQRLRNVRVSEWDRALTFEVRDQRAFVGLRIVDELRDADVGVVAFELKATLCTFKKTLEIII